MYQYDGFDQEFVRQRSAQFRDQVKRRLSGALSEAEFKPLRLMNGVYLELHAYLLRVAIPYGTLSSQQLKRLAMIGRKWDRGYGHFTTRQNIQFNWPKLEDIPDMLDSLAEVEMHAIQTSGACIRNVTADQFSGVAKDEIEDPRPWAEIIRQWSSLHPEFTFLPRKFKVSITGSSEDRAAIKVHDIGLALKKNDHGDIGFEVMVGGGQGRTPMLAQTIRDFLPKSEILPYLEAIMRVYNQFGRRDNKYKARIKILVHETGIEKLRSLVEAEYEALRASFIDLPQAEVSRIQNFFTAPPYQNLEDQEALLNQQAQQNTGFGQWLQANRTGHKQPGYAVVTISLKPIGGIPGDISSDQMDYVADLSERYGFGEIRVTHEQNLVLPDIRQDQLFDLYQDLVSQGLATANAGLISDIISCPGMDYCALATARSIPIAQALSRRFEDITSQQNIGPLKIKISGCINACGHHHVGHIGILGLERKGEEHYQLSLGGHAGFEASIGKIVGPSFKEHQIVDAVETVVQTYLDLRTEDEIFLDTYRRLGDTPFKEALYAAA